MKFFKFALIAGSAMALATTAQAQQSYKIGGGPSGGGWHPARWHPGTVSSSAWGRNLSGDDVPRHGVSGVELFPR